MLTFRYCDCCNTHHFCTVQCQGLFHSIPTVCMNAISTFTCLLLLKSPVVVCGGRSGRGEGLGGAPPPSKNNHSKQPYPNAVISAVISSRQAEDVTVVICMWIFKTIKTVMVAIGGSIDHHTHKKGREFDVARSARFGMPF